MGGSMENDQTIRLESNGFVRGERPEVKGQR